jgi:hypothetical protein
VGCGIEEQSETSVHNCSTSCPLGFGLQSRQLGCFEHFDLLGLRASIGEMANPSTIETYRGCFS